MATLSSRLSDLATAIAAKFNTMVPRLVPPGGTTGQALTKASSADHSLAWATVKGVPASGSSGQVLTKASGSDYDLTWAAAGSAPMFPGYQSGWYYLPNRTIASGTLAMGASRVYVMPTVIYSSVTLSAVAIAGAGSGNITNARAAIYSSSGGKPDAKLFVSNPVTAAVTSSSVHDFTFAANPTLAAGIYWIAVYLSSSSTMFKQFTGDLTVGYSGAYPSNYFSGTAPGFTGTDTSFANSSFGTVLTDYFGQVAVGLKVA